MAVLVVGFYDDHNFVYNSITNLKNSGYFDKISLIGREVINSQASRRLEDEIITTPIIDQPYYGSLFASVGKSLGKVKFVDFHEIGKVIFGGNLTDALVSNLPDGNNYPELLVKSMESLEIPHNKATFYFNSIRDGLVLLVVNTSPSKESEVVELLQETGVLATDITTANIDLESNI